MQSQYRTLHYSASRDKNATCNVTFAGACGLFGLVGLRITASMEEDEATRTPTVVDGVTSTGAEEEAATGSGLETGGTGS